VGFALDHHGGYQGGKWWFGQHGKVGFDSPICLIGLELKGSKWSLEQVGLVLKPTYVLFVRATCGYLGETLGAPLNKPIGQFTFVKYVVSRF
jgi:hypothetical protein